MESRRGRCSCPRVAPLLGIDLLEYRQLLSAVGKVSDIAETDRAPAFATSPSVTYSEIGSSDAKITSGSSTEDQAAARDAAGRVGTLVTRFVATEADSAAKDAGETAMAGGVVPVQAGISRLALGGTRSAPAGTVEQSPIDEQTAGLTADSSASDQSAEVAATSGLGPAPDAVSESRPPGATYAVMNPTETARSEASVSGGAVYAPTIGGPSEFREGPDWAAPATDPGSVATAERAAAAVSRLRLTVDPEMPVPREEPSDDRETAGDSAVDRTSPDPRCADLLTEIRPFSRAMLESAIDDFLDPLEGLGIELANWSPSSSLIPSATLVVGAVLATEVARRRIRGCRTHGDEGEDLFARFPGDPSCWSLGRS